jgi:hypothetical protein
MEMKTVTLAFTAMKLTALLALDTVDSMNLKRWSSYFLKLISNIITDPLSSI